MLRLGLGVSSEKKAIAAGRVWDETWVGDDEQQHLELEEEESDGSIRPSEDGSEDEDEDHSEFPNLANFPVPDELSSDEEGGGGKGSEQGSEEGSEKGGEQESEDSEEDLPLAQRKIARV